LIALRPDIQRLTVYGPARFHNPPLFRENLVWGDGIIYKIEQLISQDDNLT